MDKLSILLIQYEKLFSLYEFHHRRWDDHWKVYLIILSILTAILSAILGIESKGKMGDYCIIKVLVAFIGIVISISGCIALNRIRNDSLLTLFHLRKFEKMFTEMSLTHIPIITNGKEFFDKGEFEELRYRWFKIRKIKVFDLAVLSFILFTLFFLFNLIYAFTY
jgi:hypothetical protein